jgi:hypothetical protein
MSGFRKCVRAVDFWQKVLMMTREDLDALGVELMAADDAADPRRLAALAWRSTVMRGCPVIRPGARRSGRG